jgi:hypothetical protein
VEVERYFRNTYCLHREGDNSTLIALMMDAVSTTETLLNFPETTGYNIPEECHLHTRRRENMKSQLLSRPVGLAYLK